MGTRFARALTSSVVAAFAAALAAAETPATDPDAVLFNVKCGRCHSPVRLATRFYGVVDTGPVRAELDARLRRHFLKDADERRRIIDYLERLAKGQ